MSEKIIDIINDIREYWNVENFVKAAIQQGQLFNILKAKIKKEGKSWENWANENIKYIKSRQRQNYMKIARRKDCHQYAYLGITRLLDLINATKNMEGDNRIGDFLKKYNIETPKN